MSGARLRIPFVAMAATWAVLIVAATYLAGRAHAAPAANALIISVYGIGSVICHQLPERSFHLWSAQMPVCARCAGIYVGAAAFALGASASHGARTMQARTVLALAAVPTALTLIYEWTTGQMPSHAIRAAAGAAIGGAVAWLVVAATKNQVN
jgi:uncharacterized membrane protein